MTSEINVMQINKQRSRAAHLTALQAAHTEQQQVVCIQEPWIGPDITKEKTLSQPGYRIFTPQAHWTERPRAIIYVSSQLHSEQAYIVDEHPDMVNVTVQVENSTYMIYSIYNPPQGANRRGEALKHIINNTTAGSKTLIRGDLNFHHFAWDSDATEASREAEELTEWISATNTTILNDLSIATQESGTVLDLCLATQDLQAAVQCRSEVRTDLAVASDHEVLCTMLTWCWCKWSFPLGLRART